MIPMSRWGDGGCFQGHDNDSRLAVRRDHVERPEVVLRPIPCATCGDTFMPTTRRNRFCSAYCRLHYTQRRRLDV
jgi:hypothetical protein